MKRKWRMVGEGRGQALSAVVLAAMTVGIIASTASDEAGLAAQVAAAGGGVFVLAIIFGSGRLVGLSTLPVLAGAVLGSAAAADPAWIRSVLLGCLWYVTVEVGWDSIERRDGSERSRMHDDRRTMEMATVVGVSAAVASLGFLLRGQAPVRTLAVLAVVILVILGALTWGARSIGHPVDGADAAGPLP